MASIDLMTVMENLFCFNATESRRVVRADAAEQNGLVPELIL
jgi:hypothetical protein